MHKKDRAEGELNLYLYVPEWGSVKERAKRETKTRRSKS